ncbi:carboxylesterase/lipase family protein [Streptomyces sp. 4F14]|uniref:carboxylesterase/lipase family protein n=1 Tax=Streptomyces sp. 4F14 TaxID=3394380 RepID=UPI003A85AC1F
MTDTPLVDTTGGTLRGRPLPTGGHLFAGVPFAAPPVGGLRLRPPHPPAPWTGVRDATRFAPAPEQSFAEKSTFPTFPTALIEETSEDCLYLNVWTQPAPGPHPVILWIYGGGFESGSAAPPYSDGAALARLTGAVVVTANYRLGALGWLHLADLGRTWEGSTNLGLQDQTAALRWVRGNIAAFGGDPGNVTVAGQSAGAFSIGALLTAPAAAGLFHKAILQSGSTPRTLDRTTATALAEDLLTELGLDDPQGLRTVPVQRLLAAQTAVVSRDMGTRGLPGGRAWGVVHDGVFLPDVPRLASLDVPLLIGADRDEFRVFQTISGDAFRPADEGALHAELRRVGATDPARLLDAYRTRTGTADLAGLRAAFLGDALYRVPGARLARAQVAAGGRAFHYLIVDEPCGPDLGAFHGVDLLYVFDKLAQVGAETPEHCRVRDELAAAWRDFAAHGDPGWAPYDGNSRAFGGTSAMLAEPPEDEVTALWPAEDASPVR